MTHFIDMGCIAHKRIGKSLSVEIYLLFPRSTAKPKRLICFWLCAAAAIRGDIWKSLFAYLMKIDKITHQGAYCFFNARGTTMMAVCDPPTDRKYSPFDVDTF